MLIHLVFITIYTTSVNPFIPIPCLSVSHHREKHKNIVFPDQLYKKLQVNCLQEKSQSHTDPLLPIRIHPRKHRPNTTCPHIKSSPRNALYTLSLDPTRFKRVRARKTNNKYRSSKIKTCNNRRRIRECRRVKKKVRQGFMQKVSRNNVIKSCQTSTTLSTWSGRLC